ncbi:hypothetical protein L1049_013839 [Liquidambar formosana]|uniref:Uncharacterized protein n=1 Tax=Liquidambar formosana TaxID=63359 RepID=A0AAP0RL59_LIQFO
MASSDPELEEQLIEAGNRLLQPPSSVDELLPLLDRVENCLSRVEQSPSESTQNALSASLKALVANELLRHSDVDVKVAVASCISEITRITAPDAPYDDDQMKDIFQLIVSSFEKLSDNSSRSYNKRTSILETVAKVRSCVVMLDLECDALILEMFQHFLKAIRDYHPENVFTSMETIMTLVLEESEDIPLELLSPILACVKRDNEEVLPIARKLGEKVFENCASKLRPYMIQAVKSLDISLDDYTKVVASICQETSGDVDQNDLNATGENVVCFSLSARQTMLLLVGKETPMEVASPEEVDPAVDKSPKSVMSNGITQTGEDDALVDSNSLKKPEHGHDISESKSTDVACKAEPDSLDTGKVVELESKPEQTTKRRGRKPSSLMNSTEPSDRSQIDGEKDTDKLPDRRKSRSKEVHTSPHEEPSVEAQVPSENERETSIQLSSPKALESHAVNVTSPSPSGSLPKESRPKKGGRPKKKESLIQEAMPSADNVSKKVSEVTSDSEVKASKRSGKKAPSGISVEDATPASVDASKKDGGTASDSDAKSLKHSGRKVDASNVNEDGSSKRQKEEKKRGRGKANLEKDATKSSAKNVDKEVVSSPKSTTKSAKDGGQLEETPKMNSKRKRTPGKEKAADGKEFGGGLLKKKIKVWWPDDHMFYEGVIDSYDSVLKKHKVLYNDGDVETLNLKTERWELVEDDSVSVGEQGTDRPSPDASSETHQKKKAKMNFDSAAKQGKPDSSSKRGGGASSSKSKSATTKSGHKSRDDSKIDGKSKVDSSKTPGKYKLDNSGKSKDRTPKVGSKLIGDAPKVVGKSKNDESGTTKNNAKSKQGTSKTAAKFKGKSPKSGGKSNANGSGKVKSGSSHVKESEDVKEKSPDSAKAIDSAKRKSPDSSKVLESEVKTGKKRRKRS